MSDAVGPSVYQRMLSIIEELPAIGKDQRNQQQNFMYRGHDDVLNALNPLLAKHGVFIVPHVIDRNTDVRQTSGGKAMYEVNLHVEFTFYGEGGDSFKASAWGEGTDMGDKSTNKAMTMAFKNVIAQAFAVSTAESYDTDGQTPEDTTGRTAPRTPRVASAFDPEKDLHPEALHDKTAIAKAFTEIDGSVEWSMVMGQITEGRWGKPSWRDLEADDQKDFWRRMANTLVFIHEAWDGGFPPPSDLELAAAFAKAFGGQEIAILYGENNAALTAEQQEAFKAALAKDE